MGVGAVYDDNILWRPIPESDHIWRISPELKFTRETPHNLVIGDASFDGEWFSRNRSLSTPAARQHAALSSVWRPSAVSTLEMLGGYDSSLSPNELSPGTAITLGRTRVWRWSGGSKAAVSLTGRYDLTARYEVSSDISDFTSDTLTHDAEVGISEALNDRDSWRTQYRGQVFLFEGGPRIVSHTGLAGWTHKVTPDLFLMADGGVRFAADRLRPDINVQLAHRTTFTRSNIEYAWTQTSSLGFARLVEVQRVTGSWSHERTRHLSASLSGGAYFDDLGTTRVDVFRGGAEVGVPLGGLLSVRASYTLDYQRGRLLPVAPLFSTPLGGVATDPLFDPLIIAAPDDRVRRSVILVRLVLSSDVRRPRTDPIEEPGRRELPEPADGAQ